MMNVDTGLVATIIILSIIITMCVSFYVAHAYTEKFENWLPNCSFIEQNKKAFSSAGLLGKTMRCSMIYVYLLMPGLGESRGLLNIRDIKTFPKKLKLLLAIPWTAQLILLVALIVFTQFVAPYK